MCYSGESINAQEALAHGLVNYVVEPEALDEKVQWLLDRIVPRSPTAIRRGKYALRATQDMSFEQSIAYMETQISTLALTKDSSEGIASFNEKRAPAWSGR
jgi:enoyl-CoA hydratase/carnithine racemase